MKTFQTTFSAAFATKHFTVAINVTMTLNIMVKKIAEQSRENVVKNVLAEKSLHRKILILSCEMGEAGIA